MVRPIGFPRLAAGLAVFPLAALLAAACGGNDIVDPSDASTPLDGSVTDARGSDASDAGVGDAGSLDADAASIDADAARSDAEAGLDAEAGGDAGDGGTGLLGRAGKFAVLGGSSVTITTTAGTTIVGDVGVSPGTSVMTLPAGQPIGTVYAGGPVAAQAQSDLTTAYNTLAGRACGTVLSGDLGGRTLPPGVYCYPGTSAGLTGALVLDAQLDPNATWVIQIGSTLTTATDSTVTVINGGSACNVYWQIGTSATVGTRTKMLGNIVALTSITLVTTTTVLVGRALARNGAVTLDGCQLSAAACQ